MQSLSHYRRTLPGLLAAGSLAGLAVLASQLPLFHQLGISALTLAILAGMLAANLGPALPAGWQGGLTLAKGPLLRLGIVLFGLQLTLADIGNLGWRVMLLDISVLISTFALAQWLGKRLGLDRQSRILIGAGSAICGAAAILATQPVIRADQERASVAVAGVVLFGTVAMLAYPLLYALLAGHGLSQHAYGIMAGSTLHEVAQVLAAGKAVGEQAANSAVITKMMRVMLLAPFLLLLAAWWQRRQPQTENTAAVGFPWFALGFLAAVAVNSSGVLPESLLAGLRQLDSLLLALAMAALGLGTRFASLRAAGWRPVLLAAALLAWLMLGGAALNWLWLG